MPLKCETIFPLINEHLSKVDKNDRKVLGVLQYHITVDGVVQKSVYIDLINLKVVDGEADNADVTTKIDDEDFLEVLSKKKELAALVAEGKAEITGDIEMYKKLGAVL